MVGQKSSTSISSSAEAALLTITDSKFTDKSLFTLYMDVLLGSATKVAFGIYVSFDNGTTWYKLSVQDLTTNKGELVDIPPYVDSGSPVQSSHYRTVFTFVLPACTAIKITGLATTADSGAAVTTLLARNN